MTDLSITNLIVENLGAKYIRKPDSGCRESGVEGVRS